MLDDDPQLEAALAETVAALDAPAAAESLRADPYWPKWESPWWRILLLVELGLAARVPPGAVEALAEVCRDHWLPDFPLRLEDVPAGKDPHRHIACHCAVGSLALMLDACGLEPDARLPWLRPWLLRWQLPDGGLNCDEAAYTRPTPRSSLVSTLPALEAVLRATHRPFTPEEEGFLDRGAEYLVARRLWRSLSKGGAPMDPTWARPCFPRFYEYDLLRGLSFLVGWAERRVRPLPRAAMEEAAGLIAARLDAQGQLSPGRQAWAGARGPRREDGQWVGGRPTRSFPLLELVSAPGRPSPALTRAWRAVQAALEADRAGRPQAIRTPRLRLVPTDAASAAAGAEGSAELGAALGARVPAGWPPRVPGDDGSMTRQAFAFVRERLSAEPGLVGWWGWWALRPPRAGDGPPELVGTVSPKGPPDAEGTVELAWALTAEAEGQGYATEAAAGLLAWVRRDPRTRRVVAETLPELTGSLRVMEKLGMRPAGPGSEPGVVRWGLKV